MTAPAPGPRTLRIDLQFDGTHFLGWQRQARGRTVQAEVEAALERVLGAPHAVVASGRVDAGAHARHLVASTRTAATLPAPRLGRALDAVLPEDLGVLAVCDAPAGFHARRAALWKWYRYRILVAPTRRPLRRRWAWHRPRAPAPAALGAAAAVLEGGHDFRSFANLGSTPTPTVRTLYRLRVTARGDEVRVDAVGDGFLYKMVRNLVGSLLDAARTADPAGAAAAMLAARDRRAAGRAAPAHGLVLMAVALRGEPPPSWVPPRLLPAVDWRPGAPAKEASPATQTPDETQAAPAAGERPVARAAPGFGRETQAKEGIP